ncbi:hypothetical protein M407DRAFT_29466 [Tulasnella calospora MUT 4182]|uniref:Protein kinase domain-containing protein n=1 Tax=Tulasnella calospora MUT 4182 TaxID=1051891 RepID=A0A0C3LHL6_9AGAM|nr:hypothetical protein M407DRAFT_29466 [Tulasnella calospora MUT 4182]
MEITQPELRHRDEYTQTATDPPLASNQSDSLLPPASQVIESQVPSELSGSLEMVSISLSHRAGLSKRCYYYAHGEVFQGVLEEPGGLTRAVAMKRMIISEGRDRINLSQRVKTAAFQWGQLSHPNILQFIGYKIVDGTHWMVSQWCQHSNVTRYIANNPEITNSGKLKLLCDAARGLTYLHSLVPPVAHGYIKPNNVLVKDNLEATLCDLGDLEIFHGAKKYFTPDNSNRGDAAYRSKESLVDQDAPVTSAADVFAFGGLILAVMSGKNPQWRKRIDASRIAAICMGDIPRRADHPLLPELDPLWNIINECWSAEPEARPSMKHVLQQLERERDRRQVHENSQ